MNDNEVLAEEQLIEDAPAVENPNVSDDVIEGQDAASEIAEEPDSENSVDIDALIAEAEQRGYLRGLNEQAEKQLKRPAVGSSPENEHCEYSAENNEVMILNNIRKSVWDI